MRLGVLAFGWTFGILKHGEVLRNVIPFAQKIEKLGYYRFWITEHHDPSIAWGSPTPVVAVVAQATSKIKVGTAGILLTSHNPLEVACDFRCLATLFPGRIELGLASSPAGPNHSGLGTNTVDSVELKSLFGQKVKDLVNLCEGKTFDGGIFKGCFALPNKGKTPDIWILGAGGYGLDLAMKYKKKYSHGLFLKPKPESHIEKQKVYGKFKNQRGNIVISVVCAKTQTQAKQHYEHHLELMGFNQSNKDVWPSAIIGSPVECKKKILELAAEYGAKDFVIRSLIPHPEEHIKGFELLARALEISRRP